MGHLPALLDSDTLSEIMKGRDQWVLRNAGDYLREHSSFRFSIITRYEILRGLHAKDASRQMTAFLRQCRVSTVYPMTEEVVDGGLFAPIERPFNPHTMMLPLCEADHSLCGP